MAQNVVYLGECSVRTAKNSLMTLSIDVYYISSTDGAVEFTYVLTAFLLLDLPFVSEGGILKTPTMIADASISLCSSINFCLLLLSVKDCYVFL